MKGPQANEDETAVWATVVKLVVGALLLVAAVGLALWLAAQGPVHSPALDQAQQEVRAKAAPNSTSSDGSWGISKDSPLRK